MSFLIDPLLLILCGAVIVGLKNRLLFRITHQANTFLATTTLIIFWIVGGSLYLNMGWFDWMWQWAGQSVSGRDFMINSGIFQFDHVNTIGLVDTIALFLFLLYPAWLYCGIFLGYILFGRNEQQTGIVGLL